MNASHRTSLTIQQQYELIQKAEGKPPVTQSELAKMFSVTKSAVSKILKRKTDIIQRYETSADVTIKRIRPQPFAELNARVFEFFSEKRSKQHTLTGPLMKEQALQFAQEMGFLQFKASEGWLEKFKQRYILRLDIKF